MTRYELDVSKLARALDEQRSRMQLTWSQLAGQAGVSKNVVSRLRHGEKCSVDAFLTLLLFLGNEDICHLIRPTSKTTESRK